MRLRSICIIFSLAIVAGAAAAAGTARADTTIEVGPDPVVQAREYVAEGNMAGAIEWLNEYVQSHPDNVRARRFLGDLYFRTGKIDLAASVYQAILREDPFDKETHNRLGSVYAAQNRVDDAIKQFEAALPGTDSVNDLVALHERKGDLPAYTAKVEAAARAYPGDSGVQAELGQVLSALHHDDLAVPVYERALNDNPSDLNALNGLGLSYLALRQYDSAIDAFERCLHVDNEIFQCQNNLAAAYLESHQLIDARVALDRAYHLAPERGETFVNYGYLDDEQGNWQKATAEYAKAIELYPYLREAYIDLALDYERHDLNMLAQTVLIKGIASVYDDGRLHVLLGQAYEAQGNSADAVAQFRIGLKGTDPDAIAVANQQLSSIVVNPTSSPQ